MSKDWHTEFMKNGYLLGQDILTAEETDYYLKCFQAYEEKLGGSVKGSYRFKSHLLLPWMHQLVSHPKILDIVTSIFGPDILCWSTDLFPKEPGSGKTCAWHQDATYVGMDPPDALTVWIALTESNLDNGCVQFSRASHLQGQMEHNKTFSDDSMLLYGQEIPVDVDPATIVHAELKPGQASVHHVMTVHASGPNNSTGRRIGIAIRYCGAYIKQKEGIGDSAMLICGKDHCTFPLEMKPIREFGPEEIAEHQKAVGAVGPEDLISLK